MSQASNRGKFRSRCLARKSFRAFVGVAVVASALGLYGATASNANGCGKTDPLYCTDTGTETPAPAPVVVAPPAVKGGGPINWGQNFGAGADGYTDSSRAAHPESGSGSPAAESPAPAATPARSPAPARRVPARFTKKKAAAVVKKPAACTETTVALPKGIAFVGTKTLHTHCLHMKHDAPIFAVSQDQFNDVKLNLSTLPQTDTAKAGSFSFVCGMEKTHGNSMDIWVLAKGVKGNYGWVNSQQLVETDPKTGATPGLWMCLAAP